MYVKFHDNRLSPKDLQSTLLTKKKYFTHTIKQIHFRIYSMSKVLLYLVIPIYLFICSPEITARGGSNDLAVYFINLPIRIFFRFW